MFTTVRAIMAANHGLITRAQLMDAGLGAATIRHLIRTRQLVAVRRGVYADGEVWDALDDYRERHLLRTRAATLHMQRGFVVSHDSAAHEHHLEILTPPFPHVHVTRYGVTGAWTRNGIKHHLAPFRREQTTELDGMRVMDLARTAVDIAREHGEPYGEIACDAAMRRGVPRRELEDAVVAMSYWPHVTRTRRAVEFAEPGAANPAETLGRLLVHELGIGEIDPQFPVELEDGRVAWGDMRVGCHLFEVDGKVKYTPIEDGGVAKVPLNEVVWEEKKRERLIRRAGLGVSRIVWADNWPAQRALALVRLREEYEDTVSRLGDILPEHLVQNAERLRARRSA